MKQTEITKLTIEELEEKIDGLRKEYVDLKMKHTISPLENPLHLREMRRTIARLATEINNRD
jgi:large subunit ribosomal protein L29